jgi:hypothetical protein
MERGPMALFGAIVAVGLGPAMWLGAQFGAMGATPARPPAVSSEQQANGTAPTQQKGGEAGSAPQDPAVVLETKPRANHRAVDLTRSPSPSASSSATDRPDPGDSTTTEPTKATTSPSPSAEPSTPPTESTSEPTDSPTVPPSPPSSDSESASSRV